MPCGASRTCPLTITRTGCAWPRKKPRTLPCCRRTCRCWAIRMATFPATTACGKWSTRRAATCWRAWRWCRAPWKRGASTRFRRCAPSWPRRETWPPPPSSTSSCAMKWGTWKSATAGMATCATKGAWNRAPRMPNWRCATKRPPCAARSTWKRGAGPGFRSWNWPICPPALLHGYGWAVRLMCQWLRCPASICTLIGLIQLPAPGILSAGAAEKRPSTRASLTKLGPM